ncbi:MAG: hypothetical protein WBA93_34870 [Microcoleaceae cyanobacterium]
MVRRNYSRADIFDKCFEAKNWEASNQIRKTAKNELELLIYLNKWQEIFLAENQANRNF